MSRLFACAVTSLAVGLALVLAVSLGCATSSPDGDDGSDAGALHRDSAVVDPSEAGPVLEAGPTIPATCDKYCNLVMTNCTGANAQYATAGECAAFCSRLPLEADDPSASEKEGASVACRQYWADSPARTNPAAYCLAAGPFGGNVCGDRCTAFCTVLLDACGGNGGAPYATRPECASACANFSYRDAGADGGGEGPAGPDAGDTLNCRLYQLRKAVSDATECAALQPDSGPCD